MLTTISRLGIRTNNKCNFHCSNCSTYCNHQQNTIYWQIEDFQESLEKLQAYANIERIQIYGGESTLHPNIEHFLIKLRDVINKNTVIEFFSNAWWMPNIDRFNNIFYNIDQLSISAHPELLNKLSLDEIRQLLAKIKTQYNIKTGLFLDPGFILFGFTDIINNNRPNCRFDKCTTLLPNGTLSRCGPLFHAPNTVTSVIFNKLRQYSYYNIQSGNNITLKEWLNIKPDCCYYCTGDSIKIPHFGYDLNVIQEIQ